MRRVVVTGLGIVSSIGSDAGRSHRLAARCASRASRLLQRFCRARLQVPGVGRVRRLDPTDLVDRRAMRFLSQGGAWNHVAMKQAIANSGLEDRRSSATSAPASSWAPAVLLPARSIEAAEITLKNNSPKRIGPFAVPKAMSSTASATLATWFQIHGVNYSISSACSTSAHCIGNAAEMIQWGKQDVMFAGGHEDLDWTMSNLFDAMGAMSLEVQRHADPSRRAPMTRTATASSSPAAPAFSFWKSWSTPRRAAPRSTRKSSVTAPPRTATTWSRHQAKARLRCMRQALADREGRGRLHQYPRHLDAGRRSEGDRRHPRGLRRQDAARPVHQIADRPLARRGRRAGIRSIRSPDDAGRLHRRKRSHHASSIPNSKGCRSSASASTTPRSTRLCRTPSASAAPTRRSFSSATTDKHDERIDEAESAASSWASPTTILSPGVSPRALAAQGAELAFTYQGEALGKRVKPLAAEVGSRLRCVPCDVEDIALSRRLSSMPSRSAGASWISSSTPSAFPTRTS